MATASTTARFLCQVTGGDTGDKLVNVSWSIASPLNLIERPTITQGANNTVTVPSGATLCVITPPSDNTQSVTLKGVAGDTGYAIDANTPTIVAVSGSSFVLNLAAGSDQTFELNWL